IGGPRGRAFAEKEVVSFATSVVGIVGDDSCWISTEVVSFVGDDSCGVGIEVVSFVEDDSYYVDTDVVSSDSLPDVDDGDDAYGTSEVVGSSIGFLDKDEEQVNVILGNSTTRQEVFFL
ncbi:hypothetical protein TorRG33x02_194300, partial [Trema orientale]